jgi:hypothetical protein
MKNNKGVVHPACTGTTEGGQADARPQRRDHQSAQELVGFANVAAPPKGRAGPRYADRPFEQRSRWCNALGIAGLLGEQLPRRRLAVIDDGARAPSGSRVVEPGSGQLIRRDPTPHDRRSMAIRSR